MCTAVIPVLNIPNVNETPFPFLVAIFTTKIQHWKKMVRFNGKEKVIKSKILDSTSI